MNVQNFDNTPEREEFRFRYETPELTAFIASVQLGVVVGDSECTGAFQEQDGHDF